MPTLAITAVAVVGAVGVVAFGIQAFLFRNFERQLAALPTTQGVVERFQIEETNAQTSSPSVGKWSGHSRRLEPRVSYRYRVDGVEYVSDRLSNGSQYQTINWTSSREPNERLKALAQRFKPGSQVTVYYRPQDPAKAYLIIDTFGSKLTMTLAIVSALVLLGAIVVRLLVK